MANAQITFTQGATTGGDGYALMGSAGTPVTVSNGDDSDVKNWKFEVLDVGYGSAVTQGVVQDGENPTCSFTPDVPGGYLVKLTTTDEQGNLYVDFRVFGILEESGLFIPPFLADASSMNFEIGVGVYNAKGWSPHLAAWLQALETIIELGAVPAAPTIWIYTSGPSGGPSYSYPGGVSTTQGFDTSLGPITATIDAAPVDGEEIGAKDVGLSLETHSLTVAVGGAKIEWPVGHVGTSDLVFGAGFLGVGLLWRWYAAKDTWFFIG